MTGPWVVILAAGEGARMRSERAKVLHPLGGRPLIAYPVTLARAVGARGIVVVVGHQGDHVVLPRLTQVANARLVHVPRVEPAAQVLRHPLNSAWCESGDHLHDVGVLVYLDVLVAELEQRIHVAAGKRFVEAVDQVEALLVHRGASVAVGLRFPSHHNDADGGRAR